MTANPVELIRAGRIHRLSHHFVHLYSYSIINKPDDSLFLWLWLFLSGSTLLLCYQHKGALQRGPTVATALPLPTLDKTRNGAQLARSDLAWLAWSARRVRSQRFRREPWHLVSSKTSRWRPARDSIDTNRAYNARRCAQSIEFAELNSFCRVHI